jgi:predicted O-methyltransferase YrrM
MVSIAMIARLWRSLRKQTAPEMLARPVRLPMPLELGHEFPPYRRIFKGATPFVDADQASIAALPVEGGLLRGSVPGFLRPADALALYEIAYHARGDVLEMGSAWGLSTTIIGQAIVASGRRAKVLSIEIDPQFQSATRAAMQGAELDSIYVSLPGDATAIAPELAATNTQVGAAFIDHDHAYAPTWHACCDLSRLLIPGGLALFHDFNDERNNSEPDVYGVYRAVSEFVRDPRFAFLGTVGCCGLVQRLSA